MENLIMTFSNSRIMTHKYAQQKLNWWLKTVRATGQDMVTNGRVQWPPEVTVIKLTRDTSCLPKQQLCVREGWHIRNWGLCITFGMTTMCT